MQQAERQLHDKEKRKVKARFQQAKQAKARRAEPRAEREAEAKDALALDNNSQRFGGELANAAAACPSEAKPLDAERQEENNGPVPGQANAGPGFSSSDGEEQSATIKGSRSF